MTKLENARELVSLWKHDLHAIINHFFVRITHQGIYGMELQFFKNQYGFRRFKAHRKNLNMIRQEHIDRKLLVPEIDRELHKEEVPNPNPDGNPISILKEIF